MPVCSLFHRLITSPASLSYNLKLVVSTTPPSSHPPRPFRPSKPESQNSLPFDNRFIKSTKTQNIRVAHEFINYDIKKRWDKTFPFKTNIKIGKHTYP